MVVWAVGRKICGRAAGPEIHAHFLLAFCVSGMRNVLMAECTENTRKTCNLNGLQVLCFHYTMNEIQMVRSRTVTCVITSRRRSSPTIYLQRFISVFTDPICFRVSHSINSNHVIDAIAHNAIVDSIPDKFHLTTPTHTVFEITDAYKTVLLRCIIWNNFILHITYPLILLEFWCAIRIIDR